MNNLNRIALIAAAIALSWVEAGCSQGAAADNPGIRQIREALTFYASFDAGPDADIALGDRRLHTAESFDGLDKSQPGLHARGETTVATGVGLDKGNALRFTKAQSPVVYYFGHDNVEYHEQGWQGTASLWLKVDPRHELPAGYCDPLQITPRKWNDGAFFVDFDKEGDPRDFRLGAFPDLAIWNPENREFTQIKPEQLPMLPVHNPPFSGDRWTHIVFTWKNYNTGKTDSETLFYLDGKLHGRMTDREQTFTWADQETSRIFLGIYYVGLLDEVACFRRALTAAEVEQVYQLRTSLKAP